MYLKKVALRTVKVAIFILRPEMPLGIPGVTVKESFFLFSVTTKSTEM